ncbi:MAG: hypothetical protein V4689_18295 [Verrucomicrobiota bacterium]
MKPKFKNTGTLYLSAWFVTIALASPYRAEAADIVGDTVTTNLTVNGNTIGNGWAWFSQGLDFGTDKEASLDWVPGTGDAGTMLFDIKWTDGTFTWRDSRTDSSATNKMSLDTSNSLTLYKSDGTTTGIVFAPEEGSITLPAAGGSIKVGTITALTADAAGALVFPVSPTFSSGIEVSGGQLSVTSTNASALSVAGGISVGLDSYFNGVRIGKGQGSLTSNTTLGSSALGANTSGANNSAIGYQALRSNTTGAGNSATGANALQGNTTGGNNSANGMNALYANTTGSENTATGADALRLNTTGTKNSATGFQALYANTTGYSNSANGQRALYSNTTGWENSAAGTQALYSNTTGAANTATGSYALFTNTTGNFNSAFGSTTMMQNTTGSYNSAYGTGALRANTTGSYNLATGADALRFNTTGSDNSAVGTQALYSNTTGYGNTASGTVSLRSNVSGYQNVSYGSYALYSNNTGFLNSAVGQGSMQLNTSGRSNTATGHASLQTNTTGNFNTASGSLALYGNTTGHSNVAVGASAGEKQANGVANMLSPDNSVYIGAYSRGFNNNDNNSIVIGSGAIGEGANTTVIGNSNTVKTHLYGQVEASSFTVGDSPVQTRDSLYNTTATSFSGSSAYGYYSTASGGSGAYGDRSTAFGGGVAEGENSTALGLYSWADGVSSIAMGGYDPESTWTANQALSTGAVALGGRANTAIGDYSYAMGAWTTSSGSNSFALGTRVTSDSAYSVAVGSLNLSSMNPPAPFPATGWDEESMLFELGNGNPDASDPIGASNAITTLKNGQTTLTNKAWKADPAVAPAAENSQGEALVVEGHTRLKGKVVIEQEQGDISMGNYGDD